MHIYNELTYINKASVALGFFDGLHPAHRLVLKNAVNIAKENNSRSVVIIFENHPIEILYGTKVGRILTTEEKLQMLEKLCIDNVILLDFKDFCAMKAQDYLENVLVKYFSPIAITTGFNHSFGYNREGNGELLKNNEQKYNYKYYEVPPLCMEGKVVSCSAIRNLIKLGDFPEAEKLLGYRFFIHGTVIKGEQIASKLGFPSANIIYPECKIQIPHGVYYVRVCVEGREYNGILNHGFAPTVNNTDSLKTEVHILDFNREIYNEQIKISFITKIRNQMKFESVEKLKAQLMRDIAFADIYKYFLKSGI